MDADALAERILLDLKHIFKKDPLIDEFDILPVSESHRNTSPVIHVDHKVALEDWCIKHVYVYAYSKFFSWRKKPYKLDPESLLMWSSAILLINPEPETVWNARKELVCQNVALPENELKFSELVLRRKPKSSPVYAHRKWVLLELLKSNPSSCTTHQVVDHEIHLCTRFANLYPSNYYAWCHRLWVLTQIDGLQHKTISDELERTEKWASSHVSDYCGFHYRQFLLSCLRNNTSLISSKTFSSTHIHTSATDTNNVQNNPSYMDETSTVHKNCQAPLHFNAAIRKELDFLGGLQTIYPGHEALWYHRRYILHEIDKLGAVHSEGNGSVHQEDTVQVKVGSSYGNVSGAQKSTGLKAHSACEVHSWGERNGEDVSLENSERNLECANIECYLSSKNSNNTHIQPNIDEIHSYGAETVSMEVSVRCRRDKLDCANTAQEHSSDERGILSSIGDIHSLVLEDAKSTEGFAQCKRHKLEGDHAGRENNVIKGAIHGNNLEFCSFENVCSMDSENGEIATRTPSECKRYKLDCANTGQGLISDLSRTDINTCPGYNHGIRNDECETDPIEGSAQCKRHKLAFDTRQELQSEQKGTNISPGLLDICNSESNDSKMEEYVKNDKLSGFSTQNATELECKRSMKETSKQHKPNLEVWSLLEEESFLGKLKVKSSEGGWERTLIQRHIVWLSRTLQWSLLLS